MKTETYFCLVLSESQARFFATSKYGIDRMKALMSLVELASTENRTYEKKGFSANLNVGQLVMSEGHDERVGDCLNDTEQPHQLHTLLCVSAWYINGQMVVNPYYIPMKDRFQEGNSAPVNVPANANGNATGTSEEPTPSGKLATDVQDGNIPNQQQPVTPHSSRTSAHEDARANKQRNWPV